MQFSPCSTPAQNSIVYTRDQLIGVRATASLAPEGVYKHSHDSSFRFLVVGDTHSTRRVLFVANGKIEGAVGAFSNAEYRKIEGAVLCLEIKEPK